jgi:predicted ribosome quality control (RQC) complex YloA/Tae2 family protein
MANMHLVPSGAAVVELPDFKTGKPISIKLKSALTPQKNAEQYYRKSKNQRKEVKVLHLKLKWSKQQLSAVEEHIEFIDQCQDLKLLKNYAKDHQLNPGKQIKDSGSLFKEFKFQDFVILIGKNATNNDLLTQKYAHKEDLWLHAKDVKGSHVIIKYLPGKPFPATVIEVAARLAAYYSKRKNDSLCPVIYTPKKYVRKPKGAVPGQVVVEREKVLLVAPEAESFRNRNL